ncbi:MAG TPA: lamin tail domain-containing protein, partial [Gaiellaceae bacterium]|nr:lamin tail domain-containing protein [Gaiellaceae bacterium]
MPRWVRLVVLCAVIPLVFTGNALGAGNVVISQIYGGGGNSGAPYSNDYVELFNRSTSLINLSGWSMQYASATGTGNFGSATNLITPLDGFLAPGQYVLVEEASGGANGVALPSPRITDATPINMSATGGKVALVSSTTPLGCNGSTASPCSPAALATIVDLIGYDGANFFEGAAAAPTLSNTTAALRQASGCQDTDDNANDFAAGVPSPRTLASPTVPCGNDFAPVVTIRTPPADATGVSVDADVSVTFSEAVDVTGSWFSIACGSSGPHTATVTGGPTTFTLDPDLDFTQGETCTVTVVAADVTDQDTIDPPDNMPANETWSFATATPPPPPTFIHDIQAASHLSPLAGQLLANVPGTVTAKRSNGFYMQDPNTDANDATSEGIFVFTSSAPTMAVGDSVSVRGTVSEFRPGGASTGNLTTTELVSPVVTVLSSGNALPAPIVLGTGGRIPPSQVIEDDASGDVETSGVFDPATDGLDFYESAEGMRVQLNDPVAVGPTNSFGETPVVGDNGANAGVRTPRGGVLLRPDDGNPERLVADDVITPLPSMNVGDRYAAPLVGVMDYNFGNFLLEVTSAGARIDGGLAREVTAVPGVGELTVSTFNFENLDANDPQAKFDQLASMIVANLRSPDLISGE